MSLYLLRIIAAVEAVVYLWRYRTAVAAMVFVKELDRVAAEGVKP